MFQNRLFQTCTLFKKIHGICEHCSMVVFHILLQNVYNLLSIARIFLSIFAFTHCQATRSFVLSIVFFHYVPHVLISSKCLRGNHRVSSLGHSQGFVVISHILSNMLEISIYSIIDSNVFGVKIGGNFPLAIVKQRLVVQIGQISSIGKKCNLIMQVTRMVLDIRG